MRVLRGQGMVKETHWPHRRGQRPLRGRELLGLMHRISMLGLYEESKTGGWTPARRRKVSTRMSRPLLHAGQSPG